MAKSSTNNPKLETTRQLRLISEKEKETAKEFWKVVEKNYSTLGKKVFKHLFSNHPSYKQFFQSILGSDEDPFSNPRFQRHMLQILLPTLGGVMYNLDHPEAIHEAMKRLGVLHKRMEIGVRRENVETLGKSILVTLKMEMKNYTDEQEEAITKIMSIILNMFSNGLEGKT